MSSEELLRRVALVTGATSGIGRETALALADKGARVLVAGRNHQRGDDVVAAIHSTGGDAEFIAGDLTDAATAVAFAHSALELGEGRVDILVNNAGGGAMAPTAGFAEGDFDALFATNVKVPFYLVGAIAPGMAERGKGAIVNISSMSATLGVAGLAAYGATKAALNSLTKSWTAEFGSRGVRVNAVSPGTVRTPPLEYLGSEAIDRMGAQLPAGAVARPEQIAAVVAFLVSDAADHIYGAVLHVDGGRTAI